MKQQYPGTVFLSVSFLSQKLNEQTDTILGGWKVCSATNYCLFVSALSGILWSGWWWGWAGFHMNILSQAVACGKGVAFKERCSVFSDSNCSLWLHVLLHCSLQTYICSACLEMLEILHIFYNFSNSMALLIVKRGTRQLWIITCLTLGRLTKAMPMFVSVSQEHLDYTIIQSTNPDFNKAVVRVNVTRGHRQTVQVSGLVECCCFTPCQPWKFSECRG